MAYLHRNASPSEGFDLYNLDFSVGLGGFNLKTDVMLAQAMLNMFYFDFGGDVGPDAPNLELVVDDQDDGAPLEIDGICGYRTTQRIAWFQVGLNQSPGMSSVFSMDAVFDPYRAGAALSTISKTVYTFLELNYLCKLAGIRQDMPLIYGSLRDRPRSDIPAQLRNALKLSKSGASQYQQGIRTSSHG